MSTKTLDFPAQLYQYFQTVAYREPLILQQLRLHTESKYSNNMQISPEQGQLMRWLVQLTSAKRCLDVGTYTGYSALSVALTIPEHGEVIACDINQEWTEIANHYWQQAGVLEKIKLVLAPASRTLQSLIDNGETNQFDFAFIDADKENYQTYYDMCLELVKPGGIIAIDNVLWGGAVADEKKQDKDTISIRELNESIHQDSKVSMTMIPIGDGLTLVTKLRY